MLVYLLTHPGSLNNFKYSSTKFGLPYKMSDTKKKTVGAHTASTLQMAYIRTERDFLGQIFECPSSILPHLVSHQLHPTFVILNWACHYFHYLIRRLHVPANSRQFLLVGSGHQFFG